MVERSGWIWVSAGLLCGLIVASTVAAYYHGEYLRYQEIYNDILKDLEAVSIRVSVLIDYGNGTKEWHNDTRVPIGFSALNTTLAVARVSFTLGEYGAFISSINNVETAGNMWWSFWCWNSTSLKWDFILLACDKYILHNEDIIAWYYTSGWPPQPPY